MSLRRSIVERILKLYNITSRNLTIVNDNLSKAQGIVEVKNERGEGMESVRGMEGGRRGREKER